MNAGLLGNIWAENDGWQWATAGLVGLIALLATTIARRIVRQRYKKFAATERVELLELPLEIASKTSTLFLLVVALFLAMNALTIPPGMRSGAFKVLTIVGFWQLGIWGSAAVLAWLVMRRKQARDADRAAIGSLGILGFVLRVLVWTLVALLALDNLGIDITALVAGLGVGGIAVALAVQSVLGDLFASLSITLDRPFVLGDFIIVDDFMGSVESIGVKSTRLRSLGGEQIIMSNADLLRSRLRNYGRMLERRVVFSLGATYQTPRAKLVRIPGMIREIIERQHDTRFDRSHFSKFGAYALEFETVYYVLSSDYTRFMDLQQAIFFAIHEVFEREQIEFAYPTQTLWLSSVDGIDQTRAADAREAAMNGAQADA